MLVTAKIPTMAKASIRKFLAKNDFTFFIILNFYRFQKPLAILFFILEPRQGYNRMALRYNTNYFSYLCITSFLLRKRPGWE
ncbi:MAG: hypothetical protein EA412_00775, partial [Chitinophagaceae bacterium]